MHLLRHARLCCLARSRFGVRWVEHERGYRSQFARIVSLDYGDPELLEKFRVIYGVNASEETSTVESIMKKSP